jgi:hypothetical protein
MPENDTQMAVFGFLRSIPAALNSQKGYYPLGGLLSKGVSNIQQKWPIALKANIQPRLSRAAYFLIPTSSIDQKVMGSECEYEKGNILRAPHRVASQT